MRLRYTDVDLLFVHPFYLTEKYEKESYLLYFVGILIILPDQWQDFIRPFFAMYDAFDNL